MRDRTGKPAASKGGKAPGGRHKRGRGKPNAKKGGKHRFAVPPSTAPKPLVEAIPRFAPSLDAPSSGGTSAASAVLRTTAGTRGSVGSFMRGQRLLFVGEGNFSLALAVSLGLSTSEGVVATSEKMLEPWSGPICTSHADLAHFVPLKLFFNLVVAGQDAYFDARSKFPASMQGNVALLQSIGCRPVFGIDPRVMATADAARAHLVKAAAREIDDEEATDASRAEEKPGWPQFDQIVFAFPSAGRSSVVGATATLEMLRAFFKQASLLLRTQTKAAAAASASSAARMHLQPIIRVAMHKTPYFDNWKCGQIGQDARLRFLGEEPFYLAEYPGYAPESTQHSMKVSIASGGLEGGVSDGSGSMVWYTFTHSKASAKAAIQARRGVLAKPAEAEAETLAEAEAEEGSAVDSSVSKRGRSKSPLPAAAASGSRKANRPSAGRIGDDAGNPQTKKSKKPKTQPAVASNATSGRAAVGGAGKHKAKKSRVRKQVAMAEDEPDEDPAVTAALLAASFMRS